jgi:hypothetical protein
MTQYAILENELVVNTTVATSDYAQKQGWIELTENAGIGWSYINEQFVPPPPNQEQKKLNNAQQAKTILSNTDWTAIPDVSDPLKSNPYLVNQAEFVAYRSIIRGIAINPTWDAVFPTAPTEQWSN